VLELADRLAGLVPFVLALIAFAVVRLGPLLEPLVAQARAFLDVMNGIVDVIIFVVRDLIDNLKQAFARGLGIATVLERLSAAVVPPLRSLVAAMSETYATAKKALLDRYKELPDVITKWAADLTKAREELVKAQPLSKRIDVLKQTFILLKTSDDTPATPSSPPPKALAPWLAQAKKWSEEAATQFGKLPPLLPDIEGPKAMAERLGLKAKFGIPADIDVYAKTFEDNLPAISPSVTKYVERARHPKSIFAEERKLLAVELGKPPAVALDEAREHELELRRLMMGVIDRVLPSNLQGLAVPANEFFRQLDDMIAPAKGPKGGKGAKANSGRESFPVKELPENPQLRPLTHRLVIRCLGGAKERVEAFKNRLQEELIRQAYPTPVGA
jgi:hypothetical protein